MFTDDTVSVVSVADPDSVEVTKDPGCIFEISDALPLSVMVMDPDLEMLPLSVPDPVSVVE